jgi:hypothetical protein
MKTVATLDAESARHLGEFLKKELVPFQTQGVTEESGLDAVEILVDDVRYEAACAVIEKWESRVMAEAERQSRRRCPACQSPHLDYVPDIDYDNTQTRLNAIYRCRDCGHIVAT